MFSANYIDQSNVTFMPRKVLRKLCPFDLSKLHSKSGDTKSEQQNDFSQFKKYCTVF